VGTFNVVPYGDWLLRGGLISTFKTPLIIIIRVGGLVEDLNVCIANLFQA